ncbi:hypothetical protein SISNIDRAFT_489137 [Sistotremastrum niveocremeum HHB9708]|uniref:F-box domain-containing protein n=1 Tax=Sistotremastrum niveocremeum HHB9708 TaxID=1314777 RepID=A0A164Q9G6_9AGAM|nr:hypothetical protein SISNIDRAFT_489137 [Sistotremastrum niveocremeum HHB9708]
MISPNLDNLAVELIIEILRGVNIQTITSIALTSSRLYHIVKSERKIWIDASDVLDLPLETGETLATTPIHSLLSLSLRAILIRKRLQNPKSVPRHFRKLHEKQTSFAQKLLPGGEWMLSSQEEYGTLWLISLKDEDTSLHSSPIFVAPSDGVINCYAFEALGNREIRLAVGIETASPEGKKHHVALLRLHFPTQHSAASAPADGTPLVTNVKYYSLAAVPLSISMRKPLVLIHIYSRGRNTFNAVIFDCETEVGVMLEAHPPEVDFGAPTGPIWSWRNPHIHPALEKLVLPCANYIDWEMITTPERKVTLLADIPKISHPNEVNYETIHSIFIQSHQVLRFSHIHIENQLSSRTDLRSLPFPSRYIPITEYISNRDLVSLCLDTADGLEGGQELAAFYVKGAPLPKAWSLICSRNVYHDLMGLRPVSDRDILATYINRAHTMVSTLVIPFPSEWMPVTPQTDFCRLLDVDTVQGLALMVLQKVDRPHGPYGGHRVLHSTWLIQC